MVPGHADRGDHESGREAVARFVACHAGCGRPVRHTTDHDDGHHLATTLLDAGHISAGDLADLYHRCWSIEELYKVSKQIVAADDFRGRTERGTRQELYAHFNLIAMMRLFSGSGDAPLAETRQKDRERRAVNFKNAIASSPPTWKNWFSHRPGLSPRSLPGWRRASFGCAAGSARDSRIHGNP